MWHLRVKNKWWLHKRLILTIVSENGLEGQHEVDEWTLEAQEKCHGHKSYENKGISKVHKNQNKLWKKGLKFKSKHKTWKSKIKTWNE